MKQKQKLCLLIAVAVLGFLLCCFCARIYSIQLTTKLRRRRRRNKNSSNLKIFNPKTLTFLSFRSVLFYIFTHYAIRFQLTCFFFFFYLKSFDFILLVWFMLTESYEINMCFESLWLNRTNEIKWFFESFWLNRTNSNCFLHHSDWIVRIHIFAWFWLISYGFI